MDFTFVNPIGTTAVKLQEQIKLLNEKFGFKYEMTADTPYKDLQKMVADGQEKAKAIIEKDGGKSGGNTEASQGGGNAVYAWLKSPAYVDKDGTKRVAGGLYLIDLAKFPRLKKLPKTTCELIEGEISARKLGEIAKWFGVNVEKHDDKELLEILVKEPTLY